MKVSVYKSDKGVLSVLVQATPGKARPPVVLPVVTPGNIVDLVTPVIVGLRRPRGEPTGL